MLQIDKIFGKNIIISLPLFREFPVTPANFIQTRCMVRQPSSCTELEFPGVNLLVAGSLALQYIVVDVYKTSKQIMV